jgi:hypothetical protein
VTSTPSQKKQKTVWVFPLQSEPLKPERTTEELQICNAQASTIFFAAASGHS